MDALSIILVDVQNSNSSIRQQAEQTLHELILSSADNSIELYANFSSDTSRDINLRHLCEYIYIYYCSGKSPPADVDFPQHIIAIIILLIYLQKKHLYY